MFFKKSKSQQVVGETIKTIEIANQLNDKDRHSSAKFIIDKITKLIFFNPSLSRINFVNLLLIKLQN